MTAIAVQRCDVEAARAAYARSVREQWRPHEALSGAADALSSIRRLTALLGGPAPRDYVLVANDVLCGLPLTASSDRWTPIADHGRLRVVSRGDILEHEDPAGDYVLVRRPGGGQSRLVHVDDVTWTL
jgi:hypothetical protein